MRLAPVPPFRSAPFAALLLALAAFTLGSAAPPASAQPRASIDETPTAAPVTVVHCGRLLAVPGEQVWEEASVIIRGSRIERVVDGYVDPGAAARDLGLEPEDALVVDQKASFVLPGLFDCHTHITGQYSRDVRLRRVEQTDADAALMASVYARRTLMAGFTTIRNVGSSGDAAFALRDAIANGMLPGPRILVAGEAITPTGGHGDPTHGYREDLFDLPAAAEGVADGVAECRKAVRTQVRRGADLIKFTATGGVLSNTAAGTEQQFFSDELRAIVQTAHALGRKVAAHAHGTVGINAALRAGVDSIEHGTYLDNASIALFQRTGAFLVPTIHAGKFVEEKAEEEGYFPPPVREKAAAVGPTIQGALGRAHAGGVRIAFGTDVGVGEHGTNAREFAYMVDAGMTPMDTLVAATINAAELCALSDDLGTLEPGKLADLIGVPSSPLDDVSVMEDVRFVMKEGVVWRRAD